MAKLTQAYCATASSAGERVLYLHVLDIMVANALQALQTKGDASCAVRGTIQSS